MLHPKIMWSVWFLLCAAVSVDSYVTHDIKERLAHGRQLKIYLPKNTDKLEFSPAAEPGKVFSLWNEHRHQGSGGRGRVSGTGNDRRWYMDHVTFDDEGTYTQRDFFNREISVLRVAVVGTYTQRDFFNREISVLRVAVVARNNYIQRVPGMTLSISLEGIALDDATLTFRGPDAPNATLVRDGTPVGRDLPEYGGRIRTFSTKIDLDHVNVTDLGVFTLRDRRDRVVSTTKLELTDHLDTVAPNPLMALLLLLGIPAGICCCCRKKIFKKKSAATETCQAATPEPAPGPPPPGYNAPPMGGMAPPPGQAYPPPNPGMAGPQWNGPPQTNPGYPPQNPLYPPVQPPQWSGPPPAQYNPGAPMGYAPIMYSAPPPGGGEPVKMENLNLSPADPLLAHAPPVETASSPLAPPPVASSNPLAPPQPASSSEAYQFQLDTGKGFL